MSMQLMNEKIRMGEDNCAGCGPRMDCGLKKNNCFKEMQFNCRKSVIFAN